MAILMMCDRCKQPVTERLGDRSRIICSFRKLDESGIDKNKRALATYDLCEHCAETVQHFIEGSVAEATSAPITSPGTKKGP